MIFFDYLRERMLKFHKFHTEVWSIAINIPSLAINSALSLFVIFIYSKYSR
jgi:hypothetical protein